MDFNYDKRMGKNIRAIREKKGWTQEVLAAKLQIAGCDITRRAIAKIEVGQRHLYAHEIKSMKEIFDVSYEELFV
ncbi:MAG: helix-turn-helix transcriptional regulator [Clostridiales bacterium]|nr:helix-turn-helix transcriptional regulator [Clostridiales bacterium]